MSDDTKVCHVAAQYGQTAIIYHLALRWNVDICDVDGDGRTPLHWAAYKGFADTVRLLLVLNAEFALPDREGTTFSYFLSGTPLHHSQYSFPNTTISLVIR